MPVLRLLSIAIAFLLAGCEDPEPQTTGVVQETNMPCTGDDCACDREHSYVRELVRGCTGMTARLTVCSDEPVCDVVIDDFAARVTACTEPASPFAIDLATCLR